jgi:hypothetical protein
LVFEVVMRVVSVLVVMVLVVGVVSLLVLSLLYVLLLLVNTSLGELTTLSLRGAMVHSLPFVAIVLLQRDRDGSPVVVPLVVLVVVALVGVMEWMVLTPLWGRWLGTGFTLLVLTPVLSCLLTHVLVF